MLQLGAATIASVASTLAVGRSDTLHEEFGHSTREAPKPPPPPIAQCAQLVHPEKIWWGTELNNFLDILPDEQMLLLEKSIDNLPREATVERLRERVRSYNVFKFLAKLQGICPYDCISDDPEDDWTGKACDIAYHKVVQWVATNVGVEQNTVANGSTILVERAIQVEYFKQLWDKMTPEQRMNSLEKFSSDGEIPDLANMALMGGAAAWETLAGRDLVDGYNFYETIAEIVWKVARFFDITLPSDASAAASDIVAFFSQPIGWAIIALLSFISILKMFGGADYTKALPAVLQLHWIKVAAWKAAGLDERSLFKE
jgi:hypothetical protein